jgi:photosynthetic reaction center cytochrome c subunit
MKRPPLSIPLLLFPLLGVAIFIIGTILGRIERPPMQSVQQGPRGTGAISISNPRTTAKLHEANTIPPSVPYAGGVGPKAGSFYKNVKVLGDVDHGEFTRLMINMTTWLVPEKGCAGCHNVADFADDGLYTKVVARRMLEMVRYINTNWSAHVGKTGVTCYTCHRGKLVPPNVWFNNPGPAQAEGFAQRPAGQNHPAATVAGSSLPFDPYTPFLEKGDELRVQRQMPLRKDHGVSIKQAEWTYAMMVSMSESLGVNCNFCHVSRTFGVWAGNPPQRVTAWHGIRMVRDLNQNHLNPLKTILPRERLGAALGDAPKANCATCHNGVHKPLFGVSMVQGFPELIGVSAPAAPPR